jgi:hypothetical protein
MQGKHLDSAAFNIYQMTWFVGFPLASITYFTICKIFPPTGLGIQEDLEGFGYGRNNAVIEGKIPDAESAMTNEEKDISIATAGEKKQDDNVVSV